MADKTHLRPVLCAKSEEWMKKLEKNQDCFILEFDPYDEIGISKLALSKSSCQPASADLSVIAEKGQVACRDYPHSRHNCAKYPFEETPHDRHCKLCFCYVCDSHAPCPLWVGSSGHCHAFNTESWNKIREERRLKVSPKKARRLMVTSDYFADRTDVYVLCFHYPTIMDRWYQESIPILGTIVHYMLSTRRPSTIISCAYIPIMVLKLVLLEFAGMRRRKKEEAEQKAKLDEIAEEERQPDVDEAAMLYLEKRDRAVPKKPA